MTSSIHHASFSEATRHPRLPANVRVHLSARDFQILDRQASDTLLQRVYVGYDADRDEKVLDVFSAVNYANPQVCDHIIGMAETKGRLTVWFADMQMLTNAQRVIPEAAYRALYPNDKWAVDVVMVPVTNRLLARDRLQPSSHPLLASPARFQYGLIDLRKGGSGRAGAL
jgi:hypothetical protein